MTFYLRHCKITFKNFLWFRDIFLPPQIPLLKFFKEVVRETKNNLVKTIKSPEKISVFYDSFNFILWFPMILWNIEFFLSLMWW